MNDALHPETPASLQKRFPISKTRPKSQPVEIACSLALSDALANHYLTPLAKHPLVSKLWIIRHAPLTGSTLPNSEHIPVASAKPLRHLQMLGAARRLAKRESLAAFVSFNPIPYGFISALAACRPRQKIHYGFIGSDWYRDSQGPLGALLRPMLKKGDYLTATGERMKQDMIAHGFSEERIAILPHTIDTSVFQPAPPEQAEFDVIFVGNLIRRKRVDVIIRAFARLLSQRPQSKLCIVGDGPLRSQLEQLAGTLNCLHAIHFAGHQKEVAAYFNRARIVVIASYREGFPFALIEGMCCGLIPVSTPVGTIADLITHEKNGLLFDEENDQLLADHLVKLLSKPEYYERMRTQVLRSREQFDYSHSTRCWDGWLNSLQHGS